MAQDATAVIPPKGLWKLKLKDFLNGVYLALLPQLYVMFDFWSNSDHFPTYHEWQPYMKASIVTLVGYLLKNASTNNVGQIFQKDKPVSSVATEELNKLKEQATQNT